MIDINQVYEYEKQVDRACSAQSPEMLPERKHQKEEIEQIQDRLKQEKEQYKVPVKSWHFDQT